jgi:hypothetical protein
VSAWLAGDIVHAHPACAPAPERPAGTCICLYKEYLVPVQQTLPPQQTLQVRPPLAGKSGGYNNDAQTVTRGANGFQSGVPSASSCESANVNTGWLGEAPNMRQLAIDKRLIMKQRLALDDTDAVLPEPCVIPHPKPLSMHSSLHACSAPNACRTSPWCFIKTNVLLADHMRCIS